MDEVTWVLMGRMGVNEESFAWMLKREGRMLDGEGGGMLEGEGWVLEEEVGAEEEEGSHDHGCQGGLQLIFGQTRVRLMCFVKTWLLGGRGCKNRGQVLANQSRSDDSQKDREAAPARATKRLRPTSIAGKATRTS